MDKQTFLRIAREMREFQREFQRVLWKNQGISAPIRQKVAEAEFDKAIKELSETQGELFQ